MAKILDGKKLAEKIKFQVKEEVEKLKKKKVNIKLSVILAGDNPASQIYVKNKIKLAEEVGIQSEVLRFEKDVTEEVISYHISNLNENDDVDGILVQLPLPETIEPFRILDQIDPMKDVDGFHPYNIGLLQLGRARLKPCTPTGIIELLKEYSIEIKGKEAVVVGRSDIVGKPMAIMLLQENATVTICHSKTENLKEVTSRADILVAAIGKPGFIKRDMVKKGAVVIDVGINTIKTKSEALKFFAKDPLKLQKFMEKGSALIGDVDYCDVFDKVSYITPVPGGVGPLTVAVLMSNCLKAATARRII